VPAILGKPPPSFEKAVKDVDDKGIACGASAIGNHGYSRRTAGNFARSRRAALDAGSETFSIELLVDFTEVRLAIEPRARGKWQPRGATEAQRNHIMEAIGRMIAADAGEDDALEADIAFHVAVLEASNNRFLFGSSPI